MWTLAVPEEPQAEVVGNVIRRCLCPRSCSDFPRLAPPSFTKK